MPDTKTTEPKPIKTAGPTPSMRCRVQEQPDGALQVSFLIEPVAARKMKLKAGNVDMATYLWDNILHRAVVTHVF